MLFSILFYVVLSPLIPMIVLFVRYFQKGTNKIVISLCMIGVCALSLFLGELYADHAHGFDGFKALAAIWGGFFGMILSLIVLIVSIITKLRH